MQEFGIPATALVNSRLYAAAPGLVEAWRDAGSEIAAHGRTNGESQAGMPEDEERVLIADGADVGLLSSLAHAADAHVFDHPLAQRCRLLFLHRNLLSDGWEDPDRQTEMPTAKCTTLGSMPTLATLAIAAERLGPWAEHVDSVHSSTPMLSISGRTECARGSLTVSLLNVSMARNATAASTAR
jgi:hypothetical protein